MESCILVCLTDPFTPCRGGSELSADKRAVALWNGRDSFELFCVYTTGLFARISFPHAALSKEPRNRLKWVDRFNIIVSGGDVTLATFATSSRYALNVTAVHAMGIGA